MSHGGRSRYSRSLTVRMKDDEARSAQQIADRLACEAFNERMVQLGGPIRPSPSIGAAINGGYPYLRVECNACRQNAWVDLRKVRRTRETALWQMEASLVCGHCREHTRFPPRARIEMLCRQDCEIGPPRHQDRD